MAPRLSPLASGVLPLWQALPPPCPSVTGVVVVPVRDEATHLPVALAALAAQVDAVGRAIDPDSFEVLVLANNCSDGSVAVARACAAAHPRLRLHIAEADIPPPRAHIGYVRGQLVDEACRRLEAGGRADGFVASTDGDSRVALDWLAAIRAELAAGADAVGGRIATDPGQPLAADPLRRQRLDTSHSLLRSRLASLLDPDPADPWPRHHQHFGASLAVTVRAYRQVGGMPAVEWLEDEALVRQLSRADLRVRHSPRVRVTTSGRLDGRAAVGLAWQLRQWADARPGFDETVVESPARYARALLVRPRLRSLWARTRVRAAAAPTAAELAPLADALSLAESQLAAAWGEARTFGALWDDLDTGRQQHQGGDGDRDRVPITQAVRMLRTLVQLAARRAERPGRAVLPAVAAVAAVDASNTSSR